MKTKKNRVWQKVGDREVEKESETLVIHRDRQCFRGNMVSIVTALLRMPLVANRKEMPLTAVTVHRHTDAVTQHLCIYPSCSSANTHTHTHTCQILSRGKDPIAPQGQKRAALRVGQLSHLSETLSWGHVSALISMLHCRPNVCNRVLHQVQLLVAARTRSDPQRRALNESLSGGNGACEGQMNIKSDQTSHLGNMSRWHFSFVFSTFLDISLHRELFADPCMLSAVLSVLMRATDAVVPARSPCFSLSSCSYTGQWVLLPHLDKRNDVLQWCYMSCCNVQSALVSSLSSSTRQHVDITIGGRHVARSLPSSWASQAIT